MGSMLATVGKQVDWSLSLIDVFFVFCKKKLFTVYRGYFVLPGVQSSPQRSVQTWGLDSNVGADEHVGLKQRLREGDHQGLKQSEGRGISLLHDLPIHVHVWQSHAFPKPEQVGGIDEVRHRS